VASARGRLGTGHRHAGMGAGWSEAGPRSTGQMEAHVGDVGLLHFGRGGAGYLERSPEVGSRLGLATPLRTPGALPGAVPPRRIGQTPAVVPGDRAPGFSRRLVTGPLQIGGQIRPRRPIARDPPRDAAAPKGTSER
jgi:hypothetical protein